jgi:hypothetical protein
MSNEDLFDRLEPVLTLCRNLDFHDPEEAEQWLEEAFPAGGEAMQAARALAEQGVREGWLCNRGEGGVRYSRVCKPSGPEQICSVDAVLLAGPGPAHRHPEGEVDLCFPWDGEPRFDGRPPGWTVYPAGSEHVPTVTGGTMLILYILPGGAIEFLPRSGGERS